MGLATVPERNLSQTWRSTNLATSVQHRIQFNITRRGEESCGTMQIATSALGMMDHELARCLGLFQFLSRKREQSVIFAFNGTPTLLSLHVFGHQLLRTQRLSLSLFSFQCLPFVFSCVLSVIKHHTQHVFRHLLLHPEHVASCFSCSGNSIHL